MTIIEVFKKLSHAKQIEFTYAEGEKNTKKYITRKISADITNMQQKLKKIGYKMFSFCSRLFFY